MEDYVLTQIDKFSDGGPIEIKALGNLPFDLVADYQKKADALLFFLVTMVVFRYPGKFSSTWQQIGQFMV